jgi:hypothetical protein
MQRIELKGTSGSEAIGVLYAAERPTNRLLLQVGQDGAGGIEKFANTLTDEGWNVLLVGTAPGANADVIVGALVAAISHGGASIGPPRIVALADAVSVPTACATVLETHRRGDGAAISGLVVVDAVPDGTAHPWASLAEIAGLTTLIVARRSAKQARQSGLAWHRQLQTLDRDTHFMVLESGDSWAERLADPRDGFGREMRWLLEPVNSRTDHLA